MYYLVLETSSPRGLISFFKEEDLLFSQEVPFGVRESIELVPSIESKLQDLDLHLSQFKKIILGVGPGSFTGLRIGASVAKAFSYARKIPIIGVPSLKTYNPPQEGSFAVLLDAKIHGIYLQKGVKEKGQIYYEEEAKIYAVEQIEEQINGIPLLISAQKAPILKKLEGLIDPDILIEMASDPYQMLSFALKLPLKHHLAAHDYLDLKYFDSVA